jgi:N-acetylneuraminic acid mutarotase
MYVFGGERSAYDYSDVWKYTFATDTWEFQATTNSFAALGRHDHSAVVYGDEMYVYGGRSPSPLGDFWKYSFATKTWTEMPSSAGMMPRFGHSAGVSGDKMFVYGGYIFDSASGEGMLTDEIWSFDFGDMAWTKVGPRYDNFAADYIMDPKDAIIFPMDIPDPRFSMSSVVTGKVPGMYIIGGAGGEMMMDEENTMWRFDVAALAWTKMETNSLIARYDASAVLLSGGTYALVYGGHASGTFLGDMYLLYLGETGL